MPYTNGNLRHTIQFVCNDTGATSRFENQRNIPRVGELVTIYDENNRPMIEGRVIEVRWGYLHNDNDSVCSVIIQP